MQWHVMAIRWGVAPHKTAVEPHPLHWLGPPYLHSPQPSPPASNPSQHYSLRRRRRWSLQVRSFAGSGSAEEEGGLKEVGGPHCSLGIGRNCAAGSGSGGGEDGSDAASLHSGHTTSVTTLRGSTGDDKQGIKSFKDIRLTVGGLPQFPVAWGLYGPV